MRNHTSTQLIAKEGWKYLFFLFFIFVIASIVDCLEGVIFLLILFIAFIFRNPERLPAEDDELAILAPCDGVINSISKEKINNYELIKVTIKKSIFDVSLLRAPTLLNIHKTQRRYGITLPISSPLSKKLGEMAQVECSGLSSHVIMKINAGLLNRNIELFKTVGPLKSAQRFGLLVDGSIELYIDLDSRVKVTVGDKIKAGESVLGYFAHKGNSSDT